MNETTKQIIWSLAMALLIAMAMNMSYKLGKISMLLEIMERNLNVERNSRT